jgi:hypothetical protein
MLLPTVRAEGIAIVEALRWIVPLKELPSHRPQVQLFAVLSFWSEIAGFPVP